MRLKPRRTGWRGTVVPMSDLPNRPQPPRIYLDPGVMVGTVPSDDRREAPGRMLLTGVSDAIHHLAEGGYDLVVVGTLPAEFLAELDVEIGTVSKLPGE